MAKELKILIIDDSEVDNIVTKDSILFTKITSDVDCFTSPLDALDHLKSCSVENFPDIIFLDINMPELNGFEFLEQYKQFPEKKINHCTIFILSSSVNKEDVKRAEKEELVYQILTKPVVIPALKKLLADVA